MGYRAHWLTHEGAVAVHGEFVLAAWEREIPDRALRLLVIGIGNGGVLEVWRKTLPADSQIVGMDVASECRDLLGVGQSVITCDVTDSNAVREALRGRFFDCIIDSTGTMSAHTWPFLAPGGTLHYETYDPDLVVGLVRSVASREDSWLPVEEVLRVDVYPQVCVIEKSLPQVVPPLQMMTGNFADRIPETVLASKGIRRVV